MFETIKTVGIFMVAGQMLLHLTAGGQYGKYVKLLVWLMVLAQLLMPILSLGGFDFETSLAEAGKRMERLISQTEKDTMAGLQMEDAASMEPWESAQQRLQKESLLLSVQETTAPALEGTGYRVDQAELVYEEGTKTVSRIKLWLCSEETGTVRTVSVQVGDQEPEEALSCLLAEALGVDREKIQLIFA